MDKPLPEPFDFLHALNNVRHWLPAQGPIKDFVHHNTLHAFQHLEFHAASRAASRIYGARSYMPGEFYWAAYRSGEIPDAALDTALKAAFPEERDRSAAKIRMLSAPIQSPSFPGLARSGLRALWSDVLDGISLDRLAHPPLFRLIGGYLDQGLSIWRMPGADKKGFLEAVASLVESSWIPLDPYSSSKAATARNLLKLSAAQAATQALHHLVGDEAFFESYLLESLLAQPGWAGLVGQCEKEPSSLLSARLVTLADYAAVTLITELACLQKLLGRSFKSLAARGIPSSMKSIRSPDATVAPTEEEILLAVWQEAFEWSYSGALLGGIVTAAASAGSGRSEEITSRAFFCIDDRECSLRRHIEEINPAIETFATAGFFGLDFMYQGAEDKIAAKHCPVPVTPRHMIIEEADKAPKKRSFSWDRMQHLESGPNTFFRGWILSYVLGFGAMLRLAASVFRPSMTPVLVPPLSTVNEKGRLRLTRGQDDESSAGIHLGYTVEELADRIHGVLQSVGAQEKWPKLVVFFGHGSSSVNNPYFAAYNCGACSGRPGSPNARAFAQAANLPEVRKALLLKKGIDIPYDTWFVGALHDTSLDQVTYYDLADIPARVRKIFAGFRESVELALAANAAERCRRFETVSERLTPASALAEVRSRAVSLFEPRPEYNHATNASCIVGRRRLTERLFLDRRAFLSSYDPTHDSDGNVLAGVLSAVVPVCGGINLEYYFSRVDPNVYGAGSKLPQNVTGLIGVLNGIEGDILTGLPTQMTEIHDPIRLMLVVEQSPRIALSAVRHNPSIFEWVRNGWIRYSCIDPGTAEAFLYQNESMVRLQGLESPRKSWKSSLEAGRAGRGNLPVGVIEEVQPC